MKAFKRTAALIMVLISSLASSAAGKNPDEKQVRNVILLIADGMSISHATLARWYAGGAPLAMDAWTCGLVRTYGANTPVTDSAPAATAYATGYKSFTGYVSVMPQKAGMWGIDPQLHTDADARPLATVLEAARLAGKSTGLVATCDIPHATPAAFSAHHIHRSNYDAILKQQVYNGIDLVLAGGARLFKPKNRQDGEDLEKVLSEKGYTLIRTRSEMAAASSLKLWGMLADMDLSFDIDRTPEEPSLEEMTRKAIEMLSRNGNGFFLMVEGSKIDWASHDNDPVGVVTEVLAFDRAVKAAVEFARKEGSTAVIVVSDHGSGGLSIGDRTGTSLIEMVGLAPFIDPLKKATRTAAGVERAILESGDLSDTSLAVKIRTLYGLDLTADETQQVKNYFSNRQEGRYGLAAVIGPILSRRAHLGWTTSRHTGDDVALHVFHPRSYRPTGVVQNSDIGTYIDEIMNLNLENWNKILYLPAKKAFEEKGAAVSIEESGSGNPVLVARKGSVILRIPANKNIILVNGRTIELKTLVVYNGKAFFVPQEALEQFMILSSRRR